MKELYINAHEELIEEYMNNHPEADWLQAYYITADAAYDRYVDKFASMADDIKQRLKDEGKWP